MCKIWIFAHVAYFIEGILLNKTDLPTERCTTKDRVLHVLPKFSSLILSAVFSFWVITLLFTLFILQLILSSIKFRTSVELSSELSFASFSACTVVHWVAWKLSSTWATLFMGRKATFVERVLLGTVISISASVSREPNPSRHSTGLPRPCLRGMVMVLVKGPNSVFGDEGFFLLPLKSCPISSLTLL